VDGQPRAHELDRQEPTENQLAKAGMIAAGTAGAGAAGREALVANVSARPSGLETVTVPDKHHLWSPAIRSERNKAIKVITDWGKG
jgi:hypothetical protein